MIHIHKHIFGLLLMLIISCCSAAQTTRYNQFWNEFAFTRALSGKWSLELNLGQTWTSTPSNKKMLNRNSQWYARAWIHYYLNARWKFSFFYSYYYNQYLPEIDQDELPELRNAFQGIYYFHKIGYTLNARVRIEDRHLRTAEGVFEAYYRFRTQLKFVYPINGKNIRQGIWYGIGSDELFFKNNSQIAGKSFFDRNRLTLGGGYAVSDDVQIEVTYANEYLPRADGNEIYNALQINVGINNFISKVKNRFSHKKQPLQSLDR